MFYKNGIIVQSLLERTDYIKSYDYHGLCAYHSFPLTALTDGESRALTAEQQSKQMDDGLYQSLEFISDASLFRRYIGKCRKERIPVRALFVESNYREELWEDEIPKCEFLGYEYAPLPIDEQIATDLDRYPPFAPYVQKLNRFGLFDSMEEAEDFVQAYDSAFTQCLVGDGGFEPYICRVFQIVLDHVQ